MFNTPGSHREGPARHREQPDGTGNNRDGTIVPPGPIQSPAEIRKRTGCRRWCPGECRQSPGIATSGVERDFARLLTGFNRGSTGK
ncbi:hypothetical protein DPMN_110570 [Dreissena polymorpha]|uniref:Uncharacterized protein n=1 Tax=Dreissena polymorpha TaxID=45954 RepID=A0A9D4KCU5_DREPO|nr:hypothetical protein DPMN_110570 [Dreissena polymorpha]